MLSFHSQCEGGHPGSARYVTSSICRRVWALVLWLEVFFMRNVAHMQETVHVSCRTYHIVCAYRYQCRQAAQQGCTYDNRMAAFCAMSAQLFVPIVFSKVGTGDGQVRDSWPEHSHGGLQ